MSSRIALLSSAKRIIATHGIDAASVAAIASGAGVAKGLFFYYFRDKAAIVSTLSSEIESAYMSGLALDAHGLSPTGKLEHIFRHHFAFIEEQPESALFLYHTIMSESCRGKTVCFYDAMFTHVLDVVRAGIASGDFQCDDPDEMSYTIVGALHGVGRLKLFEFKRDYDAEAHLKHFFRTVLGVRS